MQEEREGPRFREAPDTAAATEERLSSASNDGSPRWISAVPLLPEPEQPEEEEEFSDEFEFAFVVSGPEGNPAITADEVFSNGQIRTVYPFFNRDLLLADGGEDVGGEGKSIRVPFERILIEERDACSRSASTSSSSSLDELDGVSTETYCAWTPRQVAPSPERCKKSSSTGSSLRWRIRDLVVGRSRSDGKEKFVFLPAEKKREPQKEKGSRPSPSPSRDVKAKEAGAAAPPPVAEGKKGRGNGGRVTEVDMVTAHRLYYGRSGGGQGAKGGRQSYLPYRQDLVGFFANVKGLSRTHHPY